MTDRPIIFSAPMVQALLAGRKTQTRRLMSIRGHKTFTEFGPSDTRGYDWHFRDAGARWHDLRHSELLARLRYAVGGRLWVRENCWSDWQGRDGNGVRYPADGAWIRAADEERWAALDCYAHQRHPDNATNTGQLVPSIHMPRWASRLTLSVTDVRVQRLQEISLDEVLAEGCPIDPDFHDTSQDGSGGPMVKIGIAQWRSPRGWYHLLWDELHGPGAWDANPWVVALTFTAEQRNIDAPLRCEAVENANG